MLESITKKMVRIPSESQSESRRVTAREESANFPLFVFYKDWI